MMRYEDRFVNVIAYVRENGKEYAEGKCDSWQMYIPMDGCFHRQRIIKHLAEKGIRNVTLITWKVSGDTPWWEMR